MSKKIIMDYDEYLKFKKEKEIFEKAKKESGIVLSMYDSLYSNDYIIDIPSATEEVLKNMTVKEFKQWKRNNK